MSSLSAAKLVLFAFLTGLSILFGTAPARAQPGGMTSLPVCIARVAPGSTPAAMVRGGPGYDCSGDQYRHGPGDYWALSAPVPASAGMDERHVRIPSLWQRAVTLHAFYGDGRIVTIHADSHALSRHIQLGAIVEFLLPARPAPLTRLLWRIDGAANVRGVVDNLQIGSHAQSERANIDMAALYAGFGGLAIALLVYNLATWGALRHRFQIAYCGMVAALLVYAFSSSGALAWFWPGIDNNDRLRINYAVLGLAAAAALLFARTFFEERVFGPRLHFATAAAMILLVVSGFAVWPLSYISLPFADWLYTWGIFAGLSMVFPILISAWRQHSAYLWMFTVAWAAPIIFSLARVLAGLHILPNSFWLDNSTVLSLGCEAMLSSMAIAYRVWMLSRERDAALASETIARQLAAVDPLTGLLNRRAFLDQAIGRPGAQILHVIDIDYFKRINETLGHDGGDEVLRVYARVLRAVAPDDSLVARIGGEEFALLTQAGKPVDPDHILARLRATRMPFDLTVTSSIGSCEGPLATEIDWKKLYHCADRALFDAKSAGRDRARLAQPLAVAA